MKTSSTVKSVGAGIAIVGVAVGGVADLKVRQYDNIGLVPGEVAFERSGGTIVPSTMPVAITQTGTDNWGTFFAFV